jgi:hypothetical protein
MVIYHDDCLTQKIKKLKFSIYAGVIKGVNWFDIQQTILSLSRIGILSQSFSSE